MHHASKALFLVLATVLAAGWLASCDEKPTQPEPDTVAPATPAVTPTTPAPTLQPANSSTTAPEVTPLPPPPPAATVASIARVRVFSDDGGGLVANIFLISPESVQQDLGATSADGTKTFQPPVGCPQLYHVDVQPGAGPFFNKPFDCAEVKNPLDVKLSSYQMIMILMTNFDRATVAQRPQIANELGARFRALDTNALKAHQRRAAELGLNDVVRALDVEIKGRENRGGSVGPRGWNETALDLTGRALSVSEPTRYDPLQRQVVMTPELAGRLQRFQVRERLSPTGQLDYKTLRALSGRDISEAMRR